MAVERLQVIVTLFTFCKYPIPQALHTDQRQCECEFFAQTILARTVFSASDFLLQNAEIEIRKEYAQCRDNEFRIVVHVCCFCEFRVHAITLGQHLDHSFGGRVWPLSVDQSQ